jgi:hypothetical protein
MGGLQFKGGDWDVWTENFQLSELLPVIRADANLAPISKVKLSHRGKVPGYKTASGWVGLTGRWSKDFQMTPERAQRAKQDGANIGTQGRLFPAVDLDIDDNAPLKETFKSLAISALGQAPERDREGSTRGLLMYEIAEGETPFPGWQIAFRDRQTGKAGMIELKGLGSHYVCSGEHPSGALYGWPYGYPWEVKRSKITKAQADEFRNTVVEYLDTFGYEIIKANGSASTSTKRHSLDDANLHAQSPELVIAALEAWPNTSENVPTHDDFVAALAAIKAALGPDREDHYPAVLDWGLGFPGVDEAYVHKTWHSIKDAAVGASWLFGKARAAGFTDDAQADFGGAIGNNVPAARDAAPVEADVNAGIPETEIEKMLKQWVYVQHQGRYFDTKTGQLFGPREFNAANVRVAHFGRSGDRTAEAIFQNSEDAKKVAMVTTRPGAELFTKEENEYGVKVSAVNLWRPSKLKPNTAATDADVAPYLDLAHKLFGTETPELAHFLDFNAFVLQRPGHKIGHAPVIIGPQGTGKDTILAPLFEAVGHHNIATVDTGTLDNQWTYFLKYPLVYCQEIISFGRRDRYNKLKPFISGQKSRLTINEKGQKQYSIPNRQIWIFTSNHENALALEDDDRRYWVHQVLIEAPPADDYFAKLYRWYDKGGFESVFGWLLKRDISQFDPMNRPPMTAAKRTMLDLSQPASVRWAREQLREGGMFAGRTVLTVSDLLDVADGWEVKAPEGVNHKSAAVALKAEGFAKHDHHRAKINGDAKQLWVRDPSGTLGKLPVDNIRDRYVAERSKPSTRVAA